MNIVLISANSYHIINEEVKKIVKENDYLIMNMNRSNISELLEEASYFSFDNTLKYIVVNNADFFGTGKIDEKENQKLQNFINNPNPNTIVIFTTLNGIDLRKKIVKEIKEKYTLINILPWDKKKMREEAEKYLKKYNYNIDYKTAYYIIENIYNNVDILFNELDKIMLYYNHPCTIKMEDVEKVVGKEIDSNNFHFVTAVIEKNLENSIEILNNLKIYKVEAISLIILLAREYRLMYYVKKMRNNKESMEMICKELNIQEWQATKLYNNGLKYNEEELLKCIYMLGDIDLKIKKGIYDKDTALYSFLLEACS